MILFFLAYSIPTFSQGSWNMGYVKTDSITEHLLGKKVKIDFKYIYEPGEIKCEYAWCYIRSRDSGIIEIEGEQVLFVERRKVHVDSGVFEDQYLEGWNMNGGRIQIFDCEIREIRSSRILFRLYAKILKSGNTGTPTDIEYLAWIDLNKLDGLITQQN